MCFVSIYAYLKVLLLLEGTVSHQGTSANLKMSFAETLAKHGIALREYQQSLGVENKDIIIILFLI